MEDTQPTIPRFQEYIDGWTDKNGEVHIKWLDKRRPYLKENTLEGYAAIIRRELMPRFRNLRLNQITKKLVKAMVETVLKHRALDTVKHFKHCLSAILDTAVEEELLSTNVAKDIEAKKTKKEKQREKEGKRKPHPYTRAERKIIEKAFLTHCPELYALVVTGFRAGLRIDELLALQWHDIHFDTKLIRIVRSFTKKWLSGPKSDAGDRAVRMTSQLREVLKKHRQTLEEEARQHGRRMSIWVFSDAAGEMLKYDYVYKKWNNVLDKIDLPRRTPHDTRHTYATLRLMMGHPLHEVSKEMGHADVQITYDDYFHWLPSESQSKIDDLDDTEDSLTVKAA
jgi:integrase